MTLHFSTLLTNEPRIKSSSTGVHGANNERDIYTPIQHLQICTVARKGHYNNFFLLKLSRDDFNLSRDNLELSRDN